MGETTEKDRVKTTLSEVRSLVLGVQILLGFQYRGAFEPGFARLPETARAMHVGAMLLLVLSLACMVAPSPYHRIAVGGEAASSMERYAERMALLALFPFACGLGGNIAVALNSQFGWTVSCLAGASAAGAALAGWFGPGLLARMPGRVMGDVTVSVKEKISELLTEGRIVLPGVQALLGFQFASYLTDAFARLPAAARAVNTASLLMLVGAMILLMAIVPYHRLAAGGDDTEGFERVANWLVLAPMPLVALGVSGDLFVVAQSVLGVTAGMVVSIACAVFMLALWFGFPLLARRTVTGPARR